MGKVAFFGFIAILTIMSLCGGAQALPDGSEGCDCRSCHGSRPSQCVTNTPPTANAGPDQTVAGGSFVTLNGSNSSDADGTIASHAWSQTAGPAVALSGASTARPTFTAPAGGASGTALTFRLTVRDSGGLTASDTTIVNVSPGNQPPVANAGPDQTVDEGVTVTLNGSNSSDPGGSIVSYQWSQTAGPAVTLSSATAARPTFSTPNVGINGASLTFRLTVTDNGGLQASDTSIVNVSWVNAPPIGNAGPDQTVDERVTVTLNGSASSDPDDGVGSYQWAQTAGPAVTLSNPGVANPTFAAPAGGASGTSLTFRLTVTDNGGLAAADTCIVNVRPGTPAPANETPVANAGPDQTVAGGLTVSLNGANSSDPDGAIVSYTWRQTTGPAVTLSNASAANPTFTAPAGGPTGASLTFQLTVTDDGGLTAADTCVVNVSPDTTEPTNDPPVADAGPDQTVDAGETVALDASASMDTDDGIASYLWKQTAGPAVTLSSTTEVSPSFTAPDFGPNGASLTFQVTVTDVGGLQSTATCIVNINPTSGGANLPPVADAGADQSVRSGDRVRLDGSDSSDPDGRIVSYRWSQIGGPPVSLSRSRAIAPTFRAPNAGRSGASLTFQLTVEDESGSRSSDTCIVEIRGSSRNSRDNDDDRRGDDDRDRDDD